MDEENLQEVYLGDVFNDSGATTEAWLGPRRRFPILKNKGAATTAPAAPAIEGFPSARENIEAAFPGALAPTVMADPKKIQRSKAIAATFDVPFSLAYDGEQAFTEALDKKDPNWLAESGKTVMNTIGNQYVSLGNAMEMIGYSKEQSNIYRSYGRQLANAYLPTVKVTDVTAKRFISPEWWATTGVAGVTSSLSLVPAAIVGAYGGFVTGGAVGLGVFGKTIMASLFGAAVSRPIEAAFEAAQTVEDARQKGLSEDEVERQRDYVFDQNLRLGGLDAAQIALTLTPMGSIISRAAPAVLAQRIAASRVARVAVGMAKGTAIGLSEGGEETWQTGIQQTASEGGTILDKIKRFNPEMQDAAVMGAVMGYGMAGAGSVFTSLTNRVVDSMAPKLQEEYHAQVQAGLAVGMDEHEATVSALDTIASTPEGKAHVEQVATEMKDLAEGKVKPPPTQEKIQAAVDKYIAEQEDLPDDIGDDILDPIIKGEASVDEVFGLEPDATEQAPPETKFLVSEESYQAALASLKEKTSGLHAGIDPMALGDLVKIGAYHIERGVRTFAQWSKVMLERFGDAIKPHLDNIWNQSIDMVGAGIPSGIDTDERVAEAKTVEGATQPAKDVKRQVRLTTGQERVAQVIREDVALSAAFKKAEQASRIAYAAGAKDAMAQAKADMKEIIVKAKVKAESFGFSQGFKTAERLTNRELTAANKAKEQERLDTAKTLIKMINESAIHNSMKGKFLDAIAGKLGPARVNALLDRIAAMDELATRQDLADDLKYYQSHLGRIDVEYQKRLIDLLDDINLKKISPKTKARLESLIAFAAKNGMPSGVNSKMLADIDRLQMRQPEDMNLQDLKDLRDMAEHLFEMGKLKKKLWAKYDEKMRKAAIKDAVASTNNLDAATRKQRGMWNATKGFALTAYLEVLSPFRTADLIDGAGSERGWNYIAVRQLSAKSTEAGWNTKARMNEVMEQVEKLGFAKMDMSEENLGRIIANIRILEGSPRAAQTIMEHFGWDQIDPLTTDEVKLVEALEKATNEKVAEVAAHWEERHDTPFVKRDRYILPLYYEGEYATGIDDVTIPAAHRSASVPQGFGIERIDGVKKMPRLDLFRMLEQAINEQEWFLEVQPELDNIRQVVKSKEYVEQAGQSVSNWWANLLDIVANQGITTSAAMSRRSLPWVHNWMGAARDNMITGVLGFRPSSILLQPMAVFNTLSYVSAEHGPLAAAEVLAEFGKTWASTKHFNAIVAASHSLQQRAGGEVALADLLKNTAESTRMNKFKRASMALLQKADLRTTAGSQQSIENILKKHGAANAHLEAETVTHMVASSADIVARPPIFSRGETAKTFLTFQSFMVNSFGMLTHDIVKRGVINGDAKKKIGALIGIGFFLVGKAAENEQREFIYELLFGKEKPEDRWPWWAKAMLTLASDIPFFGNVFNVVSSHGGSSEIPIQKILNDTIRDGISAMGAVVREPNSARSDPKAGEKIAKFAFQTGKAGVTVFTGVPGIGYGLDILEAQMFKNE